MFPEEIPVQNIDSTSVIEALQQIFSRMGYPTEVQTDEGMSFTSILITEYLKELVLSFREVLYIIHRAILWKDSTEL